jgi:type I restriction enzyme S subunit
VLYDRFRFADRHLAAAKHCLDRYRRAVLAAALAGRLTEDWRLANPELSATDVANRLASARTEAGRSRAPVGIAEPDLPPIPQSWQWMSIDAISSAVVDGVHQRPNYVDEGVPFLSVRNLTAGPSISFDDIKFISQEDHRTFTLRNRPERGDLLISKVGTIGVVRQVRTDREFSLFVSVALIKPLLREMSDYLEIALTAPQVQYQMLGVGMSIVNLVLREIKAEGVPIAPLAEQQVIVRRVREAFEAVDTVSSRISIARRKANQSFSAVLASAFKGELGLNGVGAGHEAATTSPR